jgi:hypothetical protein
MGAKRILGRPQLVLRTGVLFGLAQPGILPRGWDILVVAAEPDIDAIIGAEFQGLMLGNGDREGASKTGVRLLANCVQGLSFVQYEIFSLLVPLIRWWRINHCRPPQSCTLPGPARFDALPGDWNLGRITHEGFHP